MGRRLAALAVLHGLQRAHQGVILGDGARWLWRWGEEHVPDAVQIVAVCHAQEQVWEVAHAVCGRSTPQGIAWATAGCTGLFEGKLERLVQAMAAWPAVAPPPGQTRSVPEQAIGSFTCHAQRMR